MSQGCWCTGLHRRCLDSPHTHRYLKKQCRTDENTDEMQQSRSNMAPSDIYICPSNSDLCLTETRVSQFNLSKMGGACSRASYPCSFSDQAAAHIRCGSCTRSCPQSWCRRSRSRRSRWCIRRCLQEQQSTSSLAWPQQKQARMNGFCGVRTNAFHSVLSGFVTCVTGALVAADHVDALTIPAQPVAQLTLIDVWENIRQRWMYCDEWTCQPV